MKQYIVDAFTDKVFRGNPAAVCIMDAWLSDEIMLKIAQENNLSETAFAVKEGKSYHLRWFTPGGEVDLCGHATLATSFVIMSIYQKDITEITFSTLSGELLVKRKDDRFEMDFPIYQLKPVAVTQAMIDAIGVEPVEAWLGRDLVCVLSSEEEIRNNTPDMAKTLELEGLLLHTTAKGSDYDCVSRSFAPKLNIPEDPVCGSGHCHIIPIWQGKINKDEFVAYQASRRGGTLYCKLSGERILLAGKAVLYAESEIYF